MTVSNEQPSLALCQTVTLFGAFPGQGSNQGDTTTLGMVRTLAGGQGERPPAAGQLMPISENEALFNVIGTTYGGDGQETFGLPDLRGRLSIGNGQGPGLGPEIFVGQMEGSEGFNLLAANLPPGSGGTSQSVVNAQPILGSTYYINISGLFPSQGVDSTPNLPFLGSIGNFLADYAPGGYAECNGQLLPINQYQALFSILGTTYGGNGQTNFALPDMRGRAPVGTANDLTLGSMVGSTTLQITLANLPVNMGGQGQAIENQQPSLAMTMLIAADGVYDPNGGSFPDAEAMVGEVIAFAGNFEPAGYLRCDGRLLSPGDYPDLFTCIGTTYGGDGTNTFALPNLTGRSIVGTGQGPGLSDVQLGEQVGADAITLTSADMPALTLTGDASANSLYGGDANDTMNGLGGSDVLTGNGGNDVMNGGGGADTASYRYAAAGVSVSLMLAGAQATGSSGADTLTAMENLTGSGFADVLTGDSFNNRLNGLGRNDSLNGGGGDDRLFGGGGADVLNGGAGRDKLQGDEGNDRFVFTAVGDSPSGAMDTILDLESGDVIDLSAIDADTGTGGDQVFVLKGKFTGHAGDAVLKYYAASNTTRLSVDVDGDKTADMVVIITGDHAGHTGFVL
ncbi:MAG: tail fiber protein [Caulobacteraceae bacterium]